MKSKRIYNGKSVNDVLRIIAELLETGADPKEIAREIREWLERE